MNPSKPGQEGLLCRFCEERFSTNQKLLKHVRRHEKGLVCSVCKQTFSRTYLLKMHALKYAGERPYTCSVCKKIFHCKVKLNVHIFTHSGRIVNVCDVCGKKFPHKYSFDRHRLTHSGQKAHRCGICEKTFTQRGNLNRHLLIHSGLRPYVCDTCGKSFSQKAHLNIHSLIHGGEEELHACDICGKRFSEKNSLKAHLQICNRKRKPSTIARRKLPRKNATVGGAARHAGIKHAKNDSGSSVVSHSCDLKNTKVFPLANGRPLYFIKLSACDPPSSEVMQRGDCQTGEGSEPPDVKEAFHSPWELNIPDNLESLENVFAEQTVSSGPIHFTEDLFHDPSLLMDFVMAGSPGDLSGDLNAMTTFPFGLSVTVYNFTR